MVEGEKPRLPILVILLVFNIKYTKYDIDLISIDIRVDISTIKT